MADPESATSSVLVVGGGFAGIGCAAELAKHDVTVTLIDRHNYHQFQPLLYQVATAELAVIDVARPFRGIFANRPSVTVKEAEVASVDVEHRTVTTTQGDTYTGDYLVLAAGSTPNFFGVPGADQHSFPLYSVTDANRLRSRLFEVFEDAESDATRIDQGALNVVVVGAGPTGVETAGAVADLVNDVMPKRYRDLDVTRANIYLVDRGPVVLGAFSDKAHLYAAGRLVELGVKLLLQTGVKEITDDRVVLDDGSEILTRTVVWAGGIKPPELAANSGLPTGVGGRLDAQPDLTAEGHPRVYPIGDMANMTDRDGEAMPQLGSVALQAGRWAARNILADLDGKAREPFKYHDKGIMAMIGTGSAVAEVGPRHHELHGVVAFSAWLGVHAWLMSGVRQRVDAFVSWAWDFFGSSRDDAVIDPDIAVIDWGDDAPSEERTRVESFGKLEDGLLQASDWYLWGPYLSERQWGTVREDYSADGEAWDYFPHDQARSRAYRWGEDGLAGFSDVKQCLCLALALWNGRDPILKDRIFGLTGAQGNHGEDAKEYWWYVDALPSHAFNRWRYHYPQGAFPYDDLVAENGRRGKHDPEYELLDTGAFDDDRYWIVEVDYTKADPTDLLMTVRVTNAGPEQDTIHVLPTAWFRNTWSWDEGQMLPQLRAGKGSAVEIDHPLFGELELLAGNGPDGASPQLLFCDNETNTARLYGEADGSPFPKDAINDHVVGGADTVNPAATGSKAACWYRADVEPGETIEIRLRLRPRGSSTPAADAALGPSYDAVTATRTKEADDFYAELTPSTASDDEAAVMRQAFAGMLWSKQLFNYDVARWLDGDPTQPAPPASRLTGRNSRWRSFDSFDIMSMPDKWEYPWFAAWDLAFHCVALAHVDPAFAKYQLILICREWFQHPNGALPAYEWSFDDVNPPVQAWAALEVFAIDGATDDDFLRRVFDKLLVNFTWWVNREDADGSNLFEGGFLGLDNIGPIDRDHLPVAGTLEQSDATAWMALYSLHMGAMASVLARRGQPTEDLTVKFLEHFVLIRQALDEQGLWDEADGFFYDRIELADGGLVPIKVRSMVGVLPVLASVVIDEPLIHRAETLGKGFASMLGRKGFDLDALAEQGLVRGPPGDRQLLLGVVGVDKVGRLFDRLFAEDEFLSPFGMRAISQTHRDHPYELEIGELRASIDYEPAESTTDMFGGNSNWRGPIWFPLNYLLVSSIKVYGEFFGDSFTVEYPSGSGDHHTLAEVAEDLRIRLISLFLVGDDGRRPCDGEVDKLQHDPQWQRHVQFNEYFHGDNGAGLGAAHQTGWTGVVADLIRRCPSSDIASLSDLL